MLSAWSVYQPAIFKNLNERGIGMGNKKIAIIDEDEEILEELEEILTASGHVPVVINNPLLALDMAILHKPDVVLMELKLPNKNGFELAYEMNYIFQTERVPIIAMSSVFEDVPSVLMSLCGIERYIKKPVNPLDVISAIENAVAEN